jgi:hypothetical protein
MKKIIFLMMILALPLWAVKTRFRTQETRLDFAAGKGSHVSILRGGKLVPGPAIQPLLSSVDPYIWHSVVNRNGDVFLGTGNDGLVYRIDSNGDSSIFFNAPELEIFALAIDRRDRLYAASSPDGKVYRLQSSQNAEVFFDPEDRYIWSLAFDKSGNLFVATGEKARIYKISPNGESEIFFEGDHKHIRCLITDKQGFLYAGSSGSGYIYRFDPKGEPFVLYDTQLEEVNAMAICREGEIFAGAFGDASAQSKSVIQSLQKETGDSDLEKGNSKSSQVLLSRQSIMPEMFLNAGSRQNALFRIDRFGHAEDIWPFKDETVQTIMSVDSSGIYVGAGDSGNLYHLSREGEASTLLQGRDAFISHLAYTRERAILVSTSNMGKCFRIASHPVEKAVFESEPIDAMETSDWGNLDWRGHEGDGRIEFYTRSGNSEEPGQTWSEWQPVVNENNVYRIISPSFRFIQWKSVLYSSQTSQPVIDKVTISFQEKNLPPSISTIIIHEQGEYAQPEKRKSSNPDEKGIAFPQNLPSMTQKKGYRTVDWIFSDPNADRMIFDIAFQRLSSGLWHLLAEELEVNYYSWDTAQMADGHYRLKISASDHCSNPIQNAFRREKMSDIFLVDNSGPVISEFNAAFKDQNRRISFKVHDEWSYLTRIEYSVDAGGWKLLVPVDQITDAKTEWFELDLAAKKKVKSIAVRATDRLENVTVNHYSIKGD